METAGNAAYLYAGTSEAVGPARRGGVARRRWTPLDRPPTSFQILTLECPGSAPGVRECGEVGDPARAPVRSVEMGGHAPACGGGAAAVRRDVRRAPEAGPGRNAAQGPTALPAVSVGQVAAVTVLGGVARPAGSGGGPWPWGRSTGGGIRILHRGPSGRHTTRPATKPPHPQQAGSQREQPRGLGGR